jgi:hypothetical protein
MEQMYELVLDGDERLVASEEPVDVGDALILEDEILLVLRESEHAGTSGRARYEVRRALRLKHQAKELVAYAEELQLKFAEAREVRRSMHPRSSSDRPH